MFKQDCIDFGGVVPEGVIYPWAHGLLEGVLTYGEGVTQGEAVVLIPPHPNFAGSMENNVIVALSERLASMGLVTLRFNYPGIGRSQLPLKPQDSAFEFWSRVEALRNFEVPLLALDASIYYLISALKGQVRRVHLVGYSFGAWMGLIWASENSNLTGKVVAIGTPWKAAYDFAFLGQMKSSLLFIKGSKDFVDDSKQYDLASALLKSSFQEISLQGEDHFFRGREWRLMEVIYPFLNGNHQVEEAK